MTTTPNVNADAEGWKQLYLLTLAKDSGAESDESTRSSRFEAAARLAGVPLRSADFLPDLLTPDELATYLSISKNTLYAWRRDGGGPPAVQVGKHLRFPKSDVLAWSIARAA